MWATLQPHQLQAPDRRGFTIVELLIVIVVIGILAAITIVAFNGVSQRARVATLQSDLSNARTFMETYTVTNGSYPADLTTAQTAGLKGSGGTTYQYSVNNAATPSSWCLTATNSSTSYFVNNTTQTTPTSGGCPGDGVGGVAAITNLELNPSLESDDNGWGATPGQFTSSRLQSGGQWVYQATRVGSVAAAIYCSQTLPSTVTANATYSASAWVTSSVTQSITLSVRIPGTNTNIYQSATLIQANTPTRISTTGSVNSNTAVYIVVYSNSGTIGDVITADQVMLTAGSTVYNYADGSSPNWIWNGTANASTSTGPAL